MVLDSSGWSGEGTFTEILIERLRAIDAVAAVKVEDAPATRSDADYNFISHEIYVGFATVQRRETVKRFGIVPSSRLVSDKVLTFSELVAILESSDGIGAPDYADEGMIQYLRTERIVPPYQTKGYKLVELVRIYEAGTIPQR